MSNKSNGHQDGPLCGKFLLGMLMTFKCIIFENFPKKGHLRTFESSQTSLKIACGLVIYYAAVPKTSLTKGKKYVFSVYSGKEERYAYYFRIHLITSLV